MKKILALALALMLCLCSVAFAADEEATLPSYASDVTTFTFEKAYTVNKAENSVDVKYPAEVLDFEVTAKEGNPTDAMVTVTDPTIGKNPQDVVLTLPQYTVVGKYNYTVTEKAGTTQGVVYAKDDAATFDVQVLVYWNANYDKLMTSTSFTTKSGDNKVSSITNTYNLGDLTVTKKVTGNLGSKTEYFTVNVTLTSAGPVLSEITISGGSNQSNDTSIPANWTGEKVITLLIKDGETITFKNVPSGVTYAVAEDAKHAADDASGSNPSTGYTIDYTNASGTITTKSTLASEVKNEKGTTVDTGIAMDSAPYMTVLALVVVAGVMMMKKRSYNA